MIHSRMHGAMGSKEPTAPDAGKDGGFDAGIDAGKPVFTPVRTGQTSLDGQVQVLEGLKAGEAVVVYSEKELSAGMRIKVVESLAGRQP